MTLAAIPPILLRIIDILNWVVAHPEWSIGILLAVVLVLGWFFRGLKIRRGYEWGLSIVSALGILFYGYLVVTYCGSMQFYDHVEPQVAAVSYLLSRGQAVYLPPGSAARYSLQYGPFTYLWVAGYYWALGPSILTAKISGAASALAGVAVLLAALWRSAGWRVAVACAALATTFYLHFDVQSFWCRADSHEIFLVSLSLLALTLDNSWAAAIVIGISAGICVNLKINALAYFLPIGTGFVFRYRDRRAAALGVALVMVMSVVPFLFPEISLSNYLGCLWASAHQPYTEGNVRETVIFAGWMAEILLICGIPSIWSSRSAELRPWCWTAGALGAAIVVTVPFAAKSGAGPHHLMPLVPVLVWLVARCWRLGTSEEAGRVGMRHLMIVPVAAVLLVYAWAASYSVSSYVEKYEPIGRGVVADLGDIMDQVPGRTIEMGVGGNALEFLTFARPVLVFAGNPYHLDAAAAMDSSALPGGLPKGTSELCRSGLGEFVLIPKGDEPFSLRSGFPGEPGVFPEAFRRAFEENYHVRFSSNYFDVYERN
ncbi:MAG: hypothetical protein ABSF29_14835 [Tepidisphaeraceae bacterium]|jgi:hypothetical protein